MHGFLGNDPWFSMDHCWQQEVQNETHGSVALMLSRNVTLSLETPAKTFNSQHVCNKHQLDGQAGGRGGGVLCICGHDGSIAAFSEPRHAPLFRSLMVM